MQFQVSLHIFSFFLIFYKGGKIPFQNGPRLVDPRPVDDNPPPGAYFNMVDWSGSKSKLIPKVSLFRFLVLLLKIKLKKHAKIGVVFKPAIDPPSIPTQGKLEKTLIT